MSAFSVPALPATLNRELDLTSKEAARVLLNERYRQVLGFFAGQEATVSALAAQLELPVANTYYYIKVLKRLGMLEIVRTQKRAGKPLAYYRCTADSYFIPTSVAPTESIRAFFAAADAREREQLARSIEQHVYDREGWGIRLFRDDAGNFHTAFTPHKNWRDWDWLEADFKYDQAAIFAATVPLKLSREQAKSLQTELGKLFQKYYLDHSDG